MVVFNPGGGVGAMKEPLPGRTGPASPPPLAPPPAPPGPLQGVEGAGASSPINDDLPLSLPQLLKPGAGIPLFGLPPDSGKPPLGKQGPSASGTYTTQGNLGHPTPAGTPGAGPGPDELVKAAMAGLFSKNSVGGM